MSTETKNILAPTDFSEICNNAIRHGANLARLLKAKLHILHVVNSDSQTYMKKEGLTVAQLEQKLSKQAEDISSEFGVSVVPIIREGSLFDTIEKVSKEIETSLVVLGTHGKIGFQQHLTGSYALKVVTNSPSPVIVFQQRSCDEGFHNIVFPVSDTMNVRQKVSWAIAISKLFNSKIHLFRVSGSSEESEKKIRVISNQIKKAFQDRDVAFIEEMASGTGNFADQVLFYAAANKADLIMIITQKNEFMPAFFLGPWDERIIFNHSQIPVMCINPHETSTYFFKGSF